MAEAISLGASIIAFIGLAGQIAQGCSYVRTLIEDIVDAPDDVRGLQREIRLYEGTLETFREALSNLEESGIPAQQSSSVQLALEFGNETLSKITGFIKKKMKSGRRLGQVRFAFDKGKCAMHSGQVERAKGFLSMAQAGIILALEHEHTLSNRAANRALETLTSQNEINSNTIEMIPSYLDRIALDTENLYKTVNSIKNQVSGQRHDLHTAIDTILNPLLTQRFNAFTSMFSESFRAIEEVRYKTRQTREAVENMTCTSDILRGLSSEMSQIVQITFRSVLTEFYLDNRCGDFISDFAKDDPQVVLSGSSRRAIGQYRTTRKYIRQIGVITVRSITTTFLERNRHNFLDAQHPRYFTVTRTYVELCPNPELLRFGVYGLAVHYGHASFQSTPELRLRVYNVIEGTAKIAIACGTGDLWTVRQLFNSGRASPFDHVWGRESLLYVATRAMFNFGSTGNVNPTGVIAVFKELSNHGLDPGAMEFDDGMGVLCFINTQMRVEENYMMDWHLGASINTHQYLVQIFLELARFILRSSTHEPFSQEDILFITSLSHILGRKTPLLDLLQTQQEWYIEGFQHGDYRKSHEYFLRSKRLGSLIHSRLKSRMFWNLLFNRNIFKYVRRAIFGKDLLEYLLTGDLFRGETYGIGGLVVELIERHGRSSSNTMERGWGWILNILEMPKDCEMGTLVNYIWQGISSCVVNADIVQDTFEGELYGLLAYQLMRMSHPLGIPAHLERYIGIGFSNNDPYWKSDIRLVEQWSQEFPQAHDQYGRFGSVNPEKVYSTLHQPFQDDQPENYFPSDLSLLDRQEEYCLESLFLKPCEAASTTEYTTTAKDERISHEQDTELSLDTNSRHITPDEFELSPIIEEEEDTSNADEKVASISEKEVEDLQLFMDFLSL